VDALPEAGHEITEGAQLPALVEPLQTFRNAVVGRRDLIRVDGVELLSGDLRIPEDQGTAPDEMAVGSK